MSFSYWGEDYFILPKGLHVVKRDQFIAVDILGNLFVILGRS